MSVNVKAALATFGLIVACILLVAIAALTPTWVIPTIFALICLGFVFFGFREIFK